MFLGEGEMKMKRVKEQRAYEGTKELRKIIEKLKGRKFLLDCGHRVTFGHVFGNDITIYNGHKHPTIICSLCGH